MVLIDKDYDKYFQLHLSTDDLKNIDLTKISHYLIKAKDSPLPQTLEQQALLAMHYYYDTNPFFGMANSAEAGDVSVSLDNSWLQSFPAYLQPIIANLQGTPYGRKLLLELLNNSSQNSGTYPSYGHIGDVVCPVNTGCCEC